MTPGFDRGLPTNIDAVLPISTRFCANDRVQDEYEVIRWSWHGEVYWELVTQIDHTNALNT